MTIWEFLDRAFSRLPGWPTERQWVTAALVATLWILLQMAVNNPRLWDVKLFEIILQGVVLTGFLSMVLAFHFSATKGDEQKTINTGKMIDANAKAFDAIKATAPKDPKPDVVLEPGETAQAATGEE